MSVLNQTIKRAGQQYYKGSEHIAFLGYDIYIHRALMILTIYKGVNLKNNTQFVSPAQLHAELEAFKLQTLKYSENNKKKSHGLCVGAILIHNTNLKEPANNEIKYYQVVRVLDGLLIEIGEIKAEVFEHGNFKSCMPLPGIFINNTRLLKNVIKDTVDIDSGIARLLDYTLITTLADADGVPLIQTKTYKKSEYGLNCI